MTVRLYFDDAHTTTFDATVVGRRVVDGRLALALDQTCFYPTSGGQPADAGALNQWSVADVFEDDDGVIWHALESVRESAEVLPGTAVHGRVDWTRRFDHMQQHSGQHLLSRAFIEIAGAETVGFHLGVDNVTIDLDQTELPPAAVDDAERLANEIIWENRPITAVEVSRAAAVAYALRKAPAVDGERIRLVTIADFDVTPCGGTHVAASGGVGAIKIARLERRGGRLRVTFHCGARALGDYRAKHDVVGALTTALTTGAAELPATVARLQQENKALQRRLRRQAESLREHVVAALLDQAPAIGDVRLVSHVLDAAGDESPAALARALVAHDGVVALVGLPGAADRGRAQIVCARAADAAASAVGDMRPALEAALALLADGRGGGREHFAQGGAAAATPDEVRAALAAAAAALRAA